MVVEVAPAHLDHPFDYRVPEGASVTLGQRVRVVFSGRRRTGWVVGVSAETATEQGRVRDLDAVQGEHAWFDARDLRLYRWVARRYAATVADVLRHAMPSRVVAVEREISDWGAPPAWQAATRPPCPATAWRPYRASAMLKAAAATGPPGAFWWHPLHGEDTTAMALDLVARCLSAGRSALVLAPDPGSPLPQAALELAGAAGADFRSDRGARERYRGFLRALTGHAIVAVGERGALFAPLRDLGLVIVDDEANPAYKERRAPRHNARDVALARARMAGATAVLLSDLPSARLWRLLVDGHVRPVRSERGTERDRAPRVDVVDRSDPRPGSRRTRFSEFTSRAITAALRAGGAAVVVAARGGQGAALACQACGARRVCPVCDGSLRARRGGERAGGPPSEPWECPACQWSGAPFACAVCAAERTAPLAAGAGRLAQELSRSHPDAEVVRMEGFDAPGPTRRPAVAVMTRGSAVTRPAWLTEDGAAVVALPDADALLRMPAFDATEDTLRLWFAVARWTRHIVLQTREVGHPAVQALVRWDPQGFWERETPRRAELRYPPAGHLVRLKVPAAATGPVVGALREALPSGDELMGPDVGGMLLVKTADLHGTLDALDPLRRAWSKLDRKVRVDVDPV